MCFCTDGAFQSALLFCTHEGKTEAGDGVGDHLDGHADGLAGVARDGAAMSVRASWCIKAL